MKRLDFGSSWRARLAAGGLAVSLALGLAVSSLAHAQEKSARADAPGAPRGTKRAIIICGLPGDGEHRRLFAASVEKVHKALTARYGFAASEVFVRFGAASEPGDGPALTGARGLSDREGIATDVIEMRRRLGPDDTFWVIVIGHANYDGRHSHLNIPGPDLDEPAFGKLFAGISAREQVFFITTPASGFFLKPLAQPGRIVISATEADQEVNETLFPHALADVLTALPEGADRDKDGKLSVLELYLAIVGDVMKRYVDGDTVPTEHARLDDNGDGQGSEVQEHYLPPELGGRPAGAPQPKLGPKDDGALAAKTIVDISLVPKP